MWEVITLLTYSPAQPWQSSGLEEEANPGCGLLRGLSSKDVLPAGCVEFGGQSSPYLPQEDWVHMSSIRPARPDSEGGSGDYCVLNCYGGCHPSALPGHMQSPMPITALGCSLSYFQQGLCVQQGGTCEGPGHSQGHELLEDL